ncbi:MAG: hypothetical protein ACRDKJ_05515, partial [Actinomycetota bacterium]
MLRDVIGLPRRVIELQGRVIARVLTSSVRAAGAVVGIPIAALPVLTSLLAKLDPGEAGAHPFLSTGWIEAARAIREELKGKATTTPPPFRMNQVVTD